MELDKSRCMHREDTDHAHYDCRKHDFHDGEIGQEKRAHEDLILGDASLLQQETEDDAKYKIKIQQIE